MSLWATFVVTDAALGFSLWCASEVGLLLALLMAVYLQRFQILSEERAIRRLFADDYAEYCHQPGRWLSLPRRRSLPSGSG